MMDYAGKKQITITCIVPSGLEEEGDRLFHSHASWVRETHYHEGEKALVQYNLSKTTWDDGKAGFIITEIYETQRGVEDHFERGKNWEEDDKFHAFIAKCEFSLHVTDILQSFW